MHVSLEQLTDLMRDKTTVDLIAIWQVNDRSQWSDEAFVAIKQVLTTRGAVVSAQVVATEKVADLSRYKGVRGWLLVKCIGLTILTPLSIFATHGANGEDIFHPTLGLLLDIALVALCIYVGVCMWRVRPGAVKKGRWLLWALLVLNTLVFLTTFHSHDAGQARRAIGGVLSCAVWVSYLESSKRVKATYV